MRYQLVLKCQGDPLVDFERIVALMDALMTALGDSAEVDGHHFGPSGTNIFIWTTDPRATFERARPVRASGHQLDRLTAAYRAADGRHYTVIWPEGLA